MKDYGAAMIARYFTPPQFLLLQMFTPQEVQLGFYPLKFLLLQIWFWPFPLEGFYPYPISAIADLCEIVSNLVF